MTSAGLGPVVSILQGPVLLPPSGVGRRVAIPPGPPQAMHFTGRWAAVVWGCALPVLCVRSYPWALGSLRCQPAGRAANSRLLFPVWSLLVYPHLVGMALRSGHLRDNIGSRKTGGTVRLAVAVVCQSNTSPRFAKCGLAITRRDGSRTFDFDHEAL